MILDAIPDAGGPAVLGVDVLPGVAVRRAMVDVEVHGVDDGRTVEVGAGGAAGKLAELIVDRLGAAAAVRRPVVPGTIWT